MTSGKRHFIFISAAALVLALIALLFVFAPSALAQEARFTGEPLPATPLRENRCPPRARRATSP